MVGESYNTRLRERAQYDMNKGRLEVSDFIHDNIMFRKWQNPDGETFVAIMCLLCNEEYTMSFIENDFVQFSYRGMTVAVPRPIVDHMGREHKDAYEVWLVTIGLNSIANSM